MKPKLKRRFNSWWCFYMGVTGSGGSPLQAYNDMISLYETTLIRTSERFNRVGGYRHG